MDSLTIHEAGFNCTAVIVWVVELQERMLARLGAGRQFEGLWRRLNGTAR
jgi:hypothetical protein